MRRALLATLVLLSACSAECDPTPAAEASHVRPPKNRRSSGRIAAVAAPDAGFAGSATGERQWTWALLPSRCTGPTGFSPWYLDWRDGGAPDAIGVTGNDVGVSANYACAQSTDTPDAGGPLAVAGLGESLVDLAIAGSGATWAESAGGEVLPLWLADAAILVRIIYQHHASASASPTMLRVLRSASMYFDLNLSAADGTVSPRLVSTTTYQPSLTAIPAPADGQWVILDCALADPAGSGAGNRPIWTCCANGTCETGAEHTSDLASWTAGGLTIGMLATHTNGGISTGRTVAFVGVAMAGDAAWWSTAAHATDYAALGSP